MTISKGKPSSAKLGGPAAFPFMNFGKLFTMVVVINYDRAKDSLSLATTIPNVAENNEVLNLPNGIGVTYNRTNGDVQRILVPGFGKSFLKANPELSNAWAQLNPSRPTLRRVETTPFLQGLFDWIRIYAVDHQEKSPPLQWAL